MTEICTIGYETLSLPQLVDALQAAQVRAVVDVRQLANSRRAGFSKRILSATLDEAGISYLHLKALGTPKAGRDANHRGDMPTFWAIVEAALAEPAAGLALEEASALATSRTICLLCLEEDPARCHRTRVAQLLCERTGLPERRLRAGL